MINRISALFFCLFMYSSVGLAQFRATFLEGLTLADEKTPDHFGVDVEHGFRLGLADSIKDIEINFSDTKSKSTKAFEIATKTADSKPEQHLLLGLRFSDDALMVKKAIESFPSDLSYVSLLASSEKLFQENPRVFSFGIKNEEQVKRLLLELKER